MNDPQSLLRTALRANAVFSLISGAGMLIADGLVAALIGHLDALGWIRAIGLGVLLFGVYVWRLSQQTPISRGSAMAVVGADVAWVVLSWIALLAASFSHQGWWAIAIVAELVACFAIAQWFGIKRSDAATAAA